MFKVVVHFLLVEIRHLDKQVVQRAGFFAHGHHLQHQGGEKAAGRRGSGKGFATLNTFTHGQNRLTDIAIAHAGAVDRQGLQQGHASAVHHREGPGEARQGDPLENPTDNRQTQFDLVPLQGAGIGLDPFEKAKQAATEQQRQQPPEILKELRGADQDLRSPGQVRLKLGKHLGEGRNHEQVDHYQRHRHGRQHEQRVTRGLLDALAGFALQFQIDRQLAESLIELTGVFPDADHAYKQGVKHLGMSVERHGHALPAFQIAAHRLKHFAQVKVATGFGQTTNRTDDRHASLAQAVHLPTEDNQLFQVDMFAPQAFLELGEHVAVTRLCLLLDGQRGNAFGQQFTGQAVRRTGLTAADDLAALGITAGKAIEAHRPASWRHALAIRPPLHRSRWHRLSALRPRW